jgi:hypothetical protein
VGAELVAAAVRVRRERAGADVDAVLAVLAEPTEHRDAGEREAHAEVHGDAEDLDLPVLTPAAVGVAERERGAPDLRDLDAVADGLLRVLADLGHLLPHTVGVLAGLAQTLTRECHLAPPFAKRRASQEPL